MVHKRMRVVCTGMIYSHTREVKRKKGKRWLNSVHVAVSPSWRDNKNIEKNLPNLQKSLKYKRNAKSTGCQGIIVKASKPRPSKEGMKNGKKRPGLLLNSRLIWFSPWFLCLVPTNCPKSPREEDKNLCNSYVKFLKKPGAKLNKEKRWQAACSVKLN